MVETRCTHTPGVTPPYSGKYTGFIIIRKAFGWLLPGLILRLVLIVPWGFCQLFILLWHQDSEARKTCYLCEMFPPLYVSWHMELIGFKLPNQMSIAGIVVALRRYQESERLQRIKIIQSYL
ncbi:hypothetical protein ASPWEDRAFT_656808 [Aspergillus wentii DTO 134E9]|uniref:Uncharacterized protein n=1 Tax=Aspergillus wentii DTO 134E9 TaxID=1073089 RepID=A0A1L9RBI7_ASPWE|nr:uncharacterized protein ASPWEDRAFT_656808 [Aspergillus wentii DTO 134E9]OJJ32284.1 hypothetical protein ASPWEDRAFT_656808 [Aspergillus wentii DTO 134E9]